MIALLLQALFAAGASLTLVAIVRTVRHYAPAALALRQALHDCPDMQDVFVEVREMRVARPSRILRRDFTRRASAPVADCGLRAAA